MDMKGHAGVQGKQGRLLLTSSIYDTVLGSYRLTPTFLSCHLPWQLATTLGNSSLIFRTTAVEYTKVVPGNYWSG